MTFNPVTALKGLLVLGVIFAIILLAGVILVIGFTLWSILTLPLMVLIDHAIRFFLCSLVLYVVYRGVSPIVRSFRLHQEETGYAAETF